MFPAALLGGGQEAFEAESSGGLAGDGQRRDGCAGTGDGTDRNAGCGALLYQILTGIGDSGTAGIGYQGAGLAGQDPLDNFIAFECLVVLVVADKAFFDAKMV